jgi:cyclohexanone monooxygenase
VNWIVRLMLDLRAEGVARIDAQPEAQEAWAEELRPCADGALYPRARSWYLGDNVPGKPRVFLAYVGGFADYIARCEDIASSGYPGFRLTPAAELAAAQ